MSVFDAFFYSILYGYVFIGFGYYIAQVQHRGGSDGVQTET